MKKTLSLLALLTLTFGSQAHAENLIVNNQAFGRAIQVWTSEKIDGEEVLKDSVCILPYSTAYLQDFNPGSIYKLTVGYQLQGSCGGATNTIEGDFVMLSDLKADINNSYMVISPVR